MQNKKYRKIEHAFLVEGLKNVVELLNSDYEVLQVICSEKALPELMKLVKPGDLVYQTIPESQLAEIGTLENNLTVLAVAKTKHTDKLPNASTFGKLTLLLDNINDPGNLGTIIRVADWYGIKNVICSLETVDFYNPKVINASKGSFTRVHITYADLQSLLMDQAHIPLYAACLEGKSIYTSPGIFPAMLLVGNEANGIRKELLQYATHKVHIPRRGGAESLNVGVATGILVDRLLGGQV